MDNRKDGSSEGTASIDLGGGGDLTFHLMKEAHQDDLTDNRKSGSDTKPGSSPGVDKDEHDGAKIVQSSVQEDGSEHVIASDTKIEEQYNNEGIYGR